MEKRKAAKPKKVVKKAAKSKLAFNDLVLITLTRNGRRNMVGRVNAFTETNACVNFGIDENQKVVATDEEWCLFKNIKVISLKN